MFQKLKMNYSRALKGSLTRSGVLREVMSQAELELGHSLSKDEMTSLLRMFSPQTILDRIKKVSFSFSIQFSPMGHISVWLRNC